MTGRTPVRDLNRRAPEQGRVRIGKKTDKGYPTRTETFRFTSADQAAIEAIASLYGGEARRWKDAPGTATQWEVETPLARIPVALPVDCLGDGVSYEFWGGGYCLRRCDGETCDQPQDTPDGTVMMPGPCVCAGEKGKPKCKAKLRLNVVLTDIPFGGTWRLETSSEHAVRELPGMVEMILAMQSGGFLTSATLVLDQRSKVVYTKGKALTQNYGVPMLAVPHSLDAIMGGAAALSSYSSPAALGDGSSPSSVPGRGSESLDSTDDEVVEAELVDAISDEQHEALTAAADVVVVNWNAEHPEDPLTTQGFLQALAAQVSGRPVQRVAELDVNHGERIGGLLYRITSGEVMFLGVRNGRVKFRAIEKAEK